MLTDGKSRNTEFVWSNRGDRIAYASTRRNGADLDFYVMDPVRQKQLTSCSRKIKVEAGR